jgi:hypothetical protein
MMFNEQFKDAILGDILAEPISSMINDNHYILKVKLLS